ncbi:cytochrome c oxidase subunit 7A1, mitochondrial isoform X1 [Nasonia vitripennis]|uniref:Uncharacterized protein n=1 Tax=Nasonia vitripennis TaxID=7425 RepID=A0A7M6W5S0_NASVI|nr:cytochrome c oxidase subunit 7A1, mitochondrial [Nasonia vitripennis]XP_032454707.1 cytochrome c oxidase subunit 7A1, mitochondrial isoform X1 [Nasonia vitripennis]
MQCNKTVFQVLKQRSFYTKSLLRSQENQAKFVDKPFWLKKFKLKQAEMQKDDDVPVFIKKGFFDKVLYNITLGLTVFGLFWSAKVLPELDSAGKN